MGHHLEKIILLSFLFWLLPIQIHLTWKYPVIFQSWFQCQLRMCWLVPSLKIAKRRDTIGVRRPGPVTSLTNI